MRIFNYLVFLLSIFLTPLFAGEMVPIYQKNNNKYELFFDQENFSYEFKIGESMRVVNVRPDATLLDTIEVMENIIRVTSVTADEDIKILKSHLLKKMEEKLKFQPPSPEEILAKGFNNLEQVQKILSIKSDCPELPASEVSAAEFTPFVDIKLSSEDEKELQEKLVETKMAEDGFFSLGKIKSLTMTLTTYNDNLLHGGVQMLDPNLKKNSTLPWWEGDDRGLTFGASIEGKLGFEKGEVSAQGYSRGYSELTKIPVGKVAVCLRGQKCFDETIYAKRDAEGKRYQNFVTVEGIEVAVRLNKLNGQIYLKLSGGVERVTDSPSAAAAVFQKEWHAAAEERGMIQYHNVKHREDETSGKVGLEIGKEKVYEVSSWLAVRTAIAGKVQASTAMENTLVGVEAKVTIDSGRLGRDNIDTLPAVSFDVHGKKDFNAKGGSSETLGVRFFGNIYADDHGNVLGLFTGMDMVNDSYTKSYGKEEENRRHRTDLIHSYGITGQVKW